MILAIDTATRWAGLALHDGTAVIAETGWRCFNTHTIELSPAVQTMLQQANLQPDDLEAIAVAIGPGSYTGLRVGLALAKGLAMSTQSAIIGVPTLDIVAASFGPMPGQLLISAAAGRKRVCAAIYEWQSRNGWTAVDPPTIGTWDEILPTINGKTFFVGEITPPDSKKIRVANRDFRVVLPASSVRRAGYLAEIGWQRLRRGQVDNAQTIAPIYLNDPAGKPTPQK